MLRCATVFSALLSLTVVWPMKTGAKAAGSGDPAADRSGICSAAPCCTDVASRSAASTRITVDAVKERPILKGDDKRGG